LPTLNIIPLKLLFCTFTIILSMSLAHNKYHVCLLNLSAAFDTIDHNLLLSRLSSWFGIHGTVLNWFKSYLSFRSFRVRCSGSFSFSHDSLYGVPQGSVLGPLLFILYTTPLSTVILFYSLNHHLYADNTQIFSLFAHLIFILI